MWHTQPPEKRESAGKLARRCLLIVILCWAPRVSAGSEENGELPDPLPLQRILVPASRLPLELEKVRQGVLVPLKRQDFEARLRKLARSVEAFENRPSLLQARYVAEIKGNALSGRSGTWKVHCRDAGAGVMPIANLNLAIGSMRDARGAAVLLGEFDEKNLGLWVEESGDIFFDWSARGVLRADGLAFDLRIPAATSATLELILPADMVVAAEAGTIPIVGPKVAEVKTKKTWLLHVGGKSQVQFVIRHVPKGERTSGLILSRVQSRIQVSPNWLTADFDLQLDLASVGMQELTFACDPTLEPFELTARGGEVRAWEVHEESRPDAKKKAEGPTEKKIVVRFREPVQGALAGIKIRCLGAWSAGSKWTVPYARLKGGLSRGEAIRLTLSPEVRMDDWHNGGFRIVSTASESDGGQTINLVTTLMHLDGLRRPSAIPRAGGLEFEARQDLSWRLFPDRETLEADFQVLVKQGKLHQLRVLGPGGDSWTVASVQAEPKDLLASWHEKKSFVHAELSRGWTPVEPLRMKVKWTKAARIDDKAVQLAFPTVTMPDAQGLTGSLAVFLDPLLRARVLGASVAQTRTEPTNKDNSLYQFAYQNKPATGRLEVLPRRTRLAVNTRQEIQLNADAAQTLAELEFVPQAVHAPGIDLRMTPPGLAWKVVETDADSDFEDPRLTRNIERDVLQAAFLMGSDNSLNAAAILGANPGEWWRLTFSQPLRTNKKITLQGTSPRPASGFWALGLTNVAQAERQNGLVQVFAPSDRIKNSHASGLTDVHGKTDLDARTATRSFAFDESAVSTLTIETEPLGANKRANALCDQALWVTYLEPNAAPVHVFRFRFWGWQGSVIPVELPDAAEIIAIRVDQHWLTQPEWKVQLDGLTASVPVVGGAARQVDILYRTRKDEASWFPWLQVRTRPPGLPMAPLHLDRRWRLHPDLTPLQRESYCRMRDSGERPPFDLRGAWHVGNGLFLSEPSTSEHHQTVQKILAAEANLRAKHGRNSRLGEVFGNLLVDAQLTPDAIVVDRVALERAGVTPRTKLEEKGKGDAVGDMPSWEKAGLRLLAGSGGVLLTTEAKAEAMRQSAGSEWINEFDREIRQAREGGQDSTGTYRSLLVWLLGMPPGLLEAEDLCLPPEELFGASRSDFVEYRPLPALADPFSMTVVSHRTMRLLGAGFALISIALFWLFAAWDIRRAWKNRLHLALVAALAVFYLHAPATARLALIGPLIVWTLGLALTYFSFLVRMPTRLEGNTESKVRAGRALAIGAILFLMWLMQSHPAAGQVGKVDSHPVFIVEAEPGGTQTALLAPELLKKLTALEFKNRQRTVRALATGARYSGRWLNGLFEFKARYDVHCIAETATFHLPLSGVILKEGTLLDGASVFPVAAPGTKTGFLIPVQGKGMHRLEIAFDVRPSAGAEFQGIRIAIPRIAGSVLDLQMPVSLGHPVLVGCQGEETIRILSNKNRELVAKLGRENLIQVNFPLDQIPSAVPVADVRELYFWDLRPLALNLTGVFHYSVAKGALNQIEMDLPEGTDVRAVELTTSPVGPGLAATSALKRWFVSGKGSRQQLHVESTGPLAGKFQVQVSLAPRMQVAGDTLSLRLPAPVNVKIAESSLAYRLDTGKAREIPHNLTFTTITEEQFAKTWQAAGQKESAAMMTRALTFRRSNIHSGINFILSAAQSQAVLDYSWTVSARFSEVKTKIALSGGEDISMVECVAPAGIQVVRIHGVPIDHWSRKGDIVQIWLQNSKKGVTLLLEGWKSNETPATGKLGKVHISECSIPDVKVVQSRLEIKAEPGYSVEAGGVKGFKLLNRSGPHGLLYQSAGGKGVATIGIRRESVQAWLRTHTRITSENGNWNFEVLATGDFPEEQEFELELDSAPESGMVVTTGRGVQVTPRIVAGKATWSIRADKASFHPVFLEARGSAPSREPSSFAVPRLKLAGSRPGEEFIELQTANLRFEKPKDAVLIASTGLPKGFSLWRVAPEQTNSIQVRAKRPTGTPSMQIGVGQQQAFLTCEGQWLHQAAYFVLGRSGEPLRFRLPIGARLRGLLVGDQVLSAQAIDEELVTSVPSTEDVARLRIIWDYPDEKNLNRPNLSSLIFPDRVAPVLLGTVAIPAGWERRFGSAGGSQRELLVRSGEIYAKLAQDWAKAQANDRADIADWLRNEALRFATLADRTPTEGEAISRVEEVRRILAAGGQKPEGEAPTWIVEKTHPPGFEMLHAGIGSQGPVWRWAYVHEEAAPTLEIGAMRDARRTYLRKVSDLVLVIGLAVFILSLLPRSQDLLRATWPEQWILLAALGTLAWGPSLLGVSLAAIATMFRVTWMSLRIGRRVWPQRRGASALGSTAPHR